MKKILYIVFLLFCISCSNSPKYQERPLPLKNKVNLFVTEFAKEHPNWGQNDIILNKTNEKFKYQLSKFLLKKKSLDDITFKFESINEYKKGKYAAFFTNVNESFSQTQDIHIEVIGLVPYSIVTNLVKEKEYKINGNFKKFIDADLDTYFDAGMFNVEIGFNPSLDSTYFLGISLYEIKDISKP